ncbi:MAG: GTPase HflX [Lachnospiraceae bacterium]|nr:GTPase HflX [Lachnospiraceae bacterium]
MAEPFAIEELQENVILVGVSLKEEDDAWDSLDELAELVDTAGANVAGALMQNREGIHPGTYIGSGKLDELKRLIEASEATGIVCDDELSPAQLRNLEEALDTKVMDRTLIILDIFASRASTSEGKIQVELAQLKYRLSRLAGLGKSLSRLGGGIGTRGPGEKKLEMDRRYIKERIAQLNRELAQVRKHRELTRQGRNKNPWKVAAIVGYTNAGKSTLLNRLTQAGVLEEDKLFATLDPTTRSLKLDSGQEILLTDTVGFIRKLPHHLIEAFKSTLEEAKYADYLIHVVDASNPQMDKQMHIVYQTLESLGVTNKKIITLFNKLDKIEEPLQLRDLKADQTLKISAAEGTGLDQVREALEEMLREETCFLEKTFSYDLAGQIQSIRKYGELILEEYREGGIFVKAFVPREMYDRFCQDEMDCVK